jgi:glycosyltransferase involved in cell wall biosynthesis
MNTRPTSFLLISDSYPPVLGGSEIEAQRLCSAMMRRGHRALVLCSGGPPMPPVREWTDPLGVPVRILTRRATGRWKDMLFACRVAWELWRERRNYEVAYFLMQGLQLVTGLPVARALGKPIVMKISGSSLFPIIERSRAGRLELRWLRKWAARLLVLNEGMKEEAKASGFQPHQMTWMPNPVDTGEFRPGTPDEIAALRRRFSIPPNAIVAIYVGRLAPEKGLTELAGGFAQAAGGAPGALLILVGDGPARPALETLARDLGVAGRIRFAGRVEASEVPLWLRASDVFCLTSPNEGFPCALAEAMSAGLPSVVSRIPGNVQLIDDGVHGIAAGLDEESAIARALVRLLSDPAGRVRMGQAARQRIIERYATDKVMERYEAVFAEVVAGQATALRDF